MIITINLPKSKEIAHAARRVKRDEDFKPLDIKATIPAEAVQAEADRQVVRDADAITQVNVDGAIDEVSLKQVMVDSGLL